MSEAILTVEYRDVQGFPGYRVGSDGTVWTCLKRVGNVDGKCTVRATDEWRLLKPGRSVEHGDKLKEHLHVTLRKDSKTFSRQVHTLVLEAFVGPRPSGKVCRHFPDRDPRNNRVENLQWGTHKENRDDMVIHETLPKGERHGRAILTWDKVREIRARAAAGESGCGLAREFGVSQACAWKIISGKSWKESQSCDDASS